MSRMEKTSEEVIEDIVNTTALGQSEAISKVDEKVEEFTGKQAGDIDDEGVRKHAARVVLSQEKNIGSSGFGAQGDLSEVAILSIGYNRRDGNYFVTSDGGTALVVSCIVKPPHSPPGYGVLVIDSAHDQDIDQLRNVFGSLQTVRANTYIRTVGDRQNEPKLRKGGKPVYFMSSGPDVNYESVDPTQASEDDPISELAVDRDEMRNLILDNFVLEEDQVTIETVVSNSSITNDNGYPIAFGADVKHFRGEVIDSYKFSEDRGVMTLWDDTINEEDQVPEELVNDQTRTPGLNVMVDGDFVYGEHAKLDMFGPVYQNNKGQYTMDVQGVVPIVDIPYDGPVGSGNTDEDKGKTIGG